MASPRIAVEIDQPMPSNVNSACTAMAIKMESTEKAARKVHPRLQRIGTNVGAYR